VPDWGTLPDACWAWRDALVLDGLSV